MKGKLIIKNVQTAGIHEDLIKTVLAGISALSEKLREHEGLLKDLRVKRHSDPTTWQKIKTFFRQEA